MIEQGITSIGFGAFNGCKNLSDVSLPKGFITIGMKAFANCKNLSSIKLSDSVEMVDENGFYISERSSLHCLPIWIIGITSENK